MGRKHEVTEEERQAAKERRARFAGICKQVSEMSEADREALSARLMTLATCEGHGLTLHNTLLVALQHPSPTIVGGFWQWQKAGRRVRKGEHGMMIWAPKAPKGKPTATETEPATPADAATERPGFVMVTVFDVSQTEPATA